MVGDVVLSISSHLVDSIDNLVEYVSECTDVVHMEVAGSAASRIISMVKSKENPKVSRWVGSQWQACERRGRARVAGREWQGASGRA